MEYGRYVIGVLLTSSIVLGCIGVADWIVDPYEVWTSPNALIDKPLIELHQRVSEVQRALRFKPEAVILGTSRADIGLDPHHSAFRNLRSFNLATQSQPVLEARLAIERLDRPKVIVWALDFFTFGCEHLASVQDFNTDLFSDATRWRYLFSISTLRDSFVTLLRPSSQYASWNRWDAEGFRLWKDDADFIALFGYRQRSLNTEREYLTDFYGRITGIECTSSQSTAPLDHYRFALRAAHQRKIDLRLAISPLHARLLEILAAAGHWTLWENWKRGLVALNEEEARRARARPFPLWDFSGYTSITTEVLPPLADTTTRTKWYWDTSHYKKEVGDLMLDRMFGSKGAIALVPDDFGIALSGESIEEQVKATRIARQVYRLAHPIDVSEVGRTVAEVRQYQRGMRRPVVTDMH